MGDLESQTCKPILENVHYVSNLPCSMEISEIDLDGGTFKFTLPYHWITWILWVLGLLMTLVSILASIGGGGETLLLGTFGLLLMAFASPGSLEGQLKKVRENAIDPAELEAKAEASGLTVDSWLMQQTTYVPTNDPNDWILPAPGPSTWNNDDRYGPHGDGSALAEHPTKVGTPRPSTMTSFTVFSVLSVLFALVGVASLMSSQESGNSMIMPAIIIVVGLILSLVGYFRSKMLSQMMDTPTSLVRSAPIGYPELVGQVRPIADGCLTVVVDGNQNMVMHNMVGYRWEYEQYQCRTVKTDNGTREECNWVTIRSDAGGCPFILHDGTGGIRVNAQSFKRADYGQYLKRWDGAFAQTLGKQLMASAVAGLLGGAKVKKHRWTLYGLKLGNPVYVLGETKPRPSDQIAAEGLDGTLGNSIIEVWGNEDAPGVKVTLQRGTELSNVGGSRSGFEMLFPPLMLMLGGIALLGLA